MGQYGWKLMGRNRKFTVVIAKTPFFNWVQTSVGLCVSGSEKFGGKIGLILQHRDVTSRM